MLRTSDDSYCSKPAIGMEEISKKLKELELGGRGGGGVEVQNVDVQQSRDGKCAFI